MNRSLSVQKVGELMILFHVLFDELQGLVFLNIHTSDFFLVTFPDMSRHSRALFRAHDAQYDEQTQPREKGCGLPRNLV